MPKLPAYDKFSKITSDLLKIKYDTSIEDVKKTASGVEVTSTLKSKDKLSGSVKAVVKESSTKVTAEGETGGKVSLKVDQSKVLDGLDVSVEGVLQGTYSGSVKLDYTQDLFTISKKTSFKGGAVSSKIALVGGADNFALGVQVGANVYPTHEITSYDVSAKYTEDVYTAALTSENKFSLWSLYLHNKYSSDLGVGLKATYDTAKSSKQVVAGAQYAVDKDIVAKANVSWAGEINTSLKYTLANPSLSSTITTQFQNDKDGIAFKKFGVGFKF